MIIAIDGPAGSGKSTTARAVARRLGYYYLDTGAMYRAVAVVFLDRSLEPTPEAAQDVLAMLELDLRSGPDGLRVVLNGRDVSERIRERDATEMASRISKLGSIRARMVEEQRRLTKAEIGRGRGVVLEGRDIGTVVFPDADLKVFLTADLGVRANRRARQLGGAGNSETSRRVRDEMDARDSADASRATSPLRKAPDAVEIDTTEMQFSDQVSRIVALAGERKRKNAVRG